MHRPRCAHPRSAAASASSNAVLIHSSPYDVTFFRIRGQMCRGPEPAAGAYGEVQQHQRLRSRAARQASSKLTNGSNLFPTPGAAALHHHCTRYSLAAVLACPAGLTCTNSVALRFYLDSDWGKAGGVTAKAPCSANAHQRVCGCACSATTPLTAHLAGVQEPAQHVTSLQ